MSPARRIQSSALRSLSIAGALVVSVDTSTLSTTCAPSPWRSNPPFVIAHAGGEGLGPSNTIEAMVRSLDAGADILDVDLRMTSDGVIVARHDRDVASTTDGTGHVDEMTWNELQQLDAAADWTGAPIDRPVRVPSLEQILVRFPDVTFSLEIKQEAAPMGAALCEVLAETDSIERVYLSSNDDDALYAAHFACPEVLITTTYRDLDEMRAAQEGTEQWCAASPIGQPPYRDGQPDAERIQTAHRRGMALFTWTVDDPAVLRELAEAGIDGVYSRRPDVARTVFDDVAEEQAG